MENENKAELLRCIFKQLRAITKSVPNFPKTRTKIKRFYKTIKNTLQPRPGFQSVYRLIKNLILEQ